MKNLIIIATKIKEIISSFLDAVNKIHTIVFLILSLVLAIPTVISLFKKPVPANVTINPGNIIPMKPLSDYLLIITNNFTNYTNITNIINLYSDDWHYNQDSFSNVQNKDKLFVSLYNRHETVLLKQWNKENHWMAGSLIYQTQNGTAYGALLGYQLSFVGILGQVYYGNTNNYGISAGAFWRF